MKTFQHKYLIELSTPSTLDQKAEYKIQGHNRFIRIGSPFSRYFTKKNTMNVETRILKIYWPNKVSNEEILKRVGSQRISEELMIRRWRWIGHVLRMDQGSHCSISLTWTPDGKRSRGRPKTTWRRTVEAE